MADHVGRRHLAEPLGIEAHFGALAVEHLEHLVFVGSRIGRHVLGRQRLAGGVLAGRVTDHPGEVADQEDHPVPQVLELPHLVKKHRVADMQVGRGRVETGLDPQRAALAQAGGQFIHLHLTNILDGGLQLPVDVGDVDDVGIHDGQIQDAATNQGLGTPAAHPAHTEDDHARFGQSIKGRTTKHHFGPMSDVFDDRIHDG